MFVQYRFFIFSSFNGSMWTFDSFDTSVNFFLLYLHSIFHLLSFFNLYLSIWLCFDFWIFSKHIKSNTNILKKNTDWNYNLVESDILRIVNWRFNTKRNSNHHKSKSDAMMNEIEETNQNEEEMKILYIYWNNSSALFFTWIFQFNRFVSFLPFFRIFLLLLLV